MNRTTQPAVALATDGQVAYAATDRLLRRRLLERLAALQGRIVVEDAFGLTELGGDDPPGLDPISVHVTVRRPHFYRQMAFNGSVGAGESWMDGDWDCDDLVGLVRLMVRNRELLDRMEGGLAALGGWALKSWHRLRRNTRSGSRRNIAAHYDLGNPLFSLFLDRNLMYSSAVFADPGEPLEVAADRKLERICRKLGLRPDHHVVEIGTGWGGFAIHAARHHGCRVTTTTISREQFELATQRVQAAGLSDRVTVLLEDYRDLQGQYDRLVSIEMVEAIGHQYLDTYLGKCRDLLRPDGLALIQAITIEDHRYSQALASVDFIKRHIFPGSFIPSVSAILGAMARSTDFRLTSLEDIGPSYALTLRAWRQRFFANIERVRELGYDERFIRMWDFYLCYCEGGFLERSIGDAQLLFARPGNRSPEYLPDLHERMPSR